jgi:hypothetical protein
LILGNKEGFYRDLGTDIFTNNDYVRVAIWYSINLLSNPNSVGLFTSEYVTNSNPYDYFYFGLKTPNANFPDAAQSQSKFCGYYMPPRSSNGWGSALYFNGIASNSSPGYWNEFQSATDFLFFGNLTTPYAQNQFTNTNVTNLSTNKILHGTGVSAGVTGNNIGIGVLGIELRNDNTMLANFSNKSAGQVNGNTNASSSNPALSAMKNYINNQSFLSNSINLAASAPYGDATAIFMYNPLARNCIRVHGMMAAGFTR